MPKTFLSKHANRSQCHLYQSKFSFSNTWNTACQMSCIFLRKWKVELHKIKPTIGYMKMDACLKILNHWKPRTRVLPRKPIEPTRHNKEKKNNQRPQTNIPKGFVSRIKMTWGKSTGKWRQVYRVQGQSRTTGKAFSPKRKQTRLPSLTGWLRFPAAHIEGKNHTYIVSPQHRHKYTHTHAHI